MMTGAGSDKNALSGNSLLSIGATMDFAALEAFVKVVQSGSFTRAAELLGTQKARLSRVVTRLEATLGARLLERTTRSLHLTDIGRAVFERAQGILAASEDLRQFTRSLQAAPSGTLRLTCGADFGVLAAHRWIATWQQQHPAVAVQVETTSRVIDLVHEGFDLAIRVGPLDDSRLAARRLGELRYGLYASAGYVRARGAPRQPESLSQHAWLHLSANAPAKPSLRLLRRGEERRVAPSQPPALLANSTYLLSRACEAGLGIARLPWAIAGGAVRDGRLVPLLPSWEPPPSPVHAVFPSSRYLAPKVRSFIDHASAQMTRDLPDQAPQPLKGKAPPTSGATPAPRASRPGPTRR
jgi:LysR family transcriptional regulator for bpeEF and oprC